MLRVLDLFSGIGGFSLGLERTAGFKTSAFCEIDPFCRQVLAKHWPEVPCHDDVRTLTAEKLRADGISVDVICGGFPCQDISPASGGRAVGIEGERSGLWREYSRIVEEVRPSWVVVENSHFLRARGADRVLSDLEQAGYSCWPLMVGAAHAGAPHIRRRAWILAHSDQEGKPTQSEHDEVARISAACLHSDAYTARLEIEFNRNAGQQPAAVRACQWATEPGIPRVAYGVPNRVDRVAALGNAVVPQIVTAIGRAILAAEAQRQQAAA